MRALTAEEGEDRMQTEQPITITRDCEVLMIPSGEKLTLTSGSTVWLTQSLGGSYTVMTDRGYMVRLEGKDGDAIGKTPQISPTTSTQPPSTLTLVEIQDKVWQQLRLCFDPEIPVNIVDLGLIYECSVIEGEDGYRARVSFTLTAPGCGMGEVLKRDIAAKLRSIDGIREADVDLVWDPPWSQSRISPAAKQQLGME
jgi:probable FeS assembly SUF system protein SufT